MQNGPTFLIWVKDTNQGTGPEPSPLYAAIHSVLFSKSWKLLQISRVLLCWHVINGSELLPQLNQIILWDTLVFWPEPSLSTVWHTLTWQVNMLRVDEVLHSVGFLTLPSVSAIVSLTLSLSDIFVCKNLTVHVHYCRSELLSLTAIGHMFLWISLSLCLHTPFCFFLPLSLSLSLSLSLCI